MPAKSKRHKRKFPRLCISPVELPDTNDQQYEEALQYVHAYAGHVDDWLIVKKELLKTLPMKHRLLFSIRDRKTGKQVTNDFERKLAARWSELTGRRTILSCDETANSEAANK